MSHHKKQCCPPECLREITKLEKLVEDLAEKPCIQLTKEGLPNSVSTLQFPFTSQDQFKKDGYYLETNGGGEFVSITLKNTGLYRFDYWLNVVSTTAVAGLVELTADGTTIAGSSVSVAAAVDSLYSVSVLAQLDAGTKVELRNPSAVVIDLAALGTQVSLIATLVNKNY